jgi:TAL effector repeat
MPEKNLTLEQRLKKYDVTIERYHKEWNALVQYEFTEVEADHLIMRISSKQTVQAVLDHTPTLLNSPYGLNHQQIARIVSQNGGSRNIKWILKNFVQFSQRGFTAEQVVSIASHGGGTKNLEGVQKFFDALKKIGLNSAQITKIASQNGGSKNLEAVKKGLVSMQNLGFNIDQVVKIASNHGGSKNLEAVQKHFACLQEMGFNVAKIVKIVGHNGGAKKIEAIQKHHEMLLNIDLEPDEIINLISRKNGELELFRFIKKRTREKEGIDGFLFFINNVGNLPQEQMPSLHNSNSIFSSSINRNDSIDELEHRDKRIRTAPQSFKLNDTFKC